MPPRKAMLIGHQQPREAFLDALARGRMHHAWLIVGPKGIGKRAFADWAALKLLSGDRGEGDTPSNDPAASLVALARGAPGTVADMAGADLGSLEKALDRIAAGGDPVPLARGVQPQSAIPKLRALLALVPRRLAAAARKNPDPRLFDLYAEAELLARDAVRLAYDRPQVAMALADITARAGRIQDHR